MCFDKMFSKIANYSHILKARVVVAYALFHVFGACSGVLIRSFIYKSLAKNTLFLITKPLICLNKGFPIKIGFKHQYAKPKKQ